MSLISVAEARARLMALAPAIPVEHIQIGEAAGRWLADPIIARRTQPASDLSAMDGYAIRHADLPGPFRVIGEIAAGRPFDGTVAQREAVRIFTGAAMPAGADCVLVQEEADRDGERLNLAGEGPGHVGRNVRPRGLDFLQGDRLIEAGERLTPARVALGLIGGVTEVAVRRRVRVAIVATGDELARGDATRPEPLPESNVAMIIAQLRDLPCDLTDLGILPDRLDILTEAFRTIDADVLVTTGGASVGDHDLVRPALEAAGGELDFWRVALRPGKPMMAARLSKAVAIGLPGNPVSAFVGTELFVKPLVAAMGGASDPAPEFLRATLADGLPANGTRADYIRAAMVDGRVSAAAVQDSSMLRTLARSNCLIVREPNAPPAQAGDSVEILAIA